MRKKWGLKICMKYLYDKEIVLYFIGFFSFFLQVLILLETQSYNYSSILEKVKKMPFYQ